LSVLPVQPQHPPVRGLVGAEADHAEVHGADAVSVELGLEFGDVLVGQVLVEAHVAGVGAETLAGIELDHLAAGLGGLLDRLERGEAVEAIRLAADREPADAVGVRDALRGGARPRPPQSSEPAAARAGPVSDPDGASESADWRAALRGADAPTAATPTPSPEVSSVPSDALGGLVTGAPFPGLDGVLVGVVHAGAPAPLFDGDGIRALPSLDAVAETVRRCTRCPLYKTATHGVPGEGNPEADFVVVGEAPGADEDASGRPFVGASGQLLTKILSAINLAREDVFICNVVKHRPPGNRNPAPDEVAACSPYLIRQLELVRPKVILTVGNFAAQTLLDTKLGIGKLRGQVHLYHGVPLVATYHPAALLRNPTWKRPTWEDVQLARRLLDRAAAPG